MTTTYRTEFRVPKMDCSAEEQLIRMKLEYLGTVKRLQFDLPARRLEVFHSGTAQEILNEINQLNLGAIQVAHEESTFSGSQTEAGSAEKVPLIAALTINACFFLAELVAGILAYSLGLIADSLDMLADAIVYGMALAAVGGSATKKLGIAKLTGYFQGFLACAGLVEVLRRAVVGEGAPDYRTMIILSCLALVGNAATLFILNRTKGLGVHMKAAWICTSVDVQVNALVIGAGVVVYLTGSRYPDLVAGGLIFLLVANGARKILALGK